MKPYTLTDRAGESISPMTSTRTVFDENGVDLDTLLTRQKSDTEAALKEYPKKTEVVQALADKQDALSTTTDLHITDDNIIGLTEAAKMKLFVDLWNEACGKWGRYNAETGFFELNGLTDITYEEAVVVMVYGVRKLDRHEFSEHKFGRFIRTNLPCTLSYGSTVSGQGLFYGQKKLEVAFLYSPEVADPWNNFITMNPASHMFSDCSMLRKVVGRIRLTNLAYINETFRGCRTLEDIDIILDGVDRFSFQDSPNISLPTAKFMVDNYMSGKPIITVHPDVYAKLTDETNEEWHAVLEAAAKKNITFATV